MAFVITDTELKLMAAAIVRLSEIPNPGAMYSLPASSVTVFWQHD